MGLRVIINPIVCDDPGMKVLSVIYLMRETTDAQALSAVQHWLSQKPIQAIVASPAAVDGARRLADYLDLTLQIDDAWRDIDQGSITDDLWLRAILERWKQGERDAAFVGGDRFADVLRRLQIALHRLSPDAKTLVVSHNDLIHSLVPYLCVNAAALQMRDPLTPGGFVILERYDTRRFICWSWNLVDHLNT
jgi:broad specificity phosphatase PhoE